MVVVVVVVVSRSKSERCVVVARDSAVVSTHEQHDYCTVGWDWGGMGDGGTGDGAWEDGVPSKKMMSMSHWHLGLAGLAGCCAVQ